MHYPHHPAVIIYPPALWTAALFAGFLLHFVAPFPIGASGELRIIGAVLLLASIALILWARAVFERHGENTDPTTETRHLIVDAGPYRYSRNPMYISMIIALFALALILNSWWLAAATVVVCIIFHYGVILREERYLLARFGKHFEAYKQKVGRWV